MKKGGVIIVRKSYFAHIVVKSADILFESADIFKETLICCPKVLIYSENRSYQLKTADIEDNMNFYI